MSQDQDENIVDNIEDENDTRDNSVVALERSAFGGWRDNTKGINKKKNKDGKLILGRPSTPKKTSQDSSFIAEGQQIVLNPQEDAKSNGYTLGGRIQNMVDNPTSKIENKKNKKESPIDDVEDGILDEVDDENLTNRAIRACLAAEATIAALREECVFLPIKSSDDKYKIGHAKRGCNCPGKGASCNAAISLQLQLAACENLSLAATAAFRELVAARLGVSMPTMPTSRSVSPKKQRKKPKKPKNATLSEEVVKTPIGLQPILTPRESIVLPKRKSSLGANSGCVSLSKEQPPIGPFNCTHLIPDCVPLTKPQGKSPLLIIIFYFQ